MFVKSIEIHYYDVSLLQTSIVTSELVIVLECQTDVFQNTSLLIPLNEGLTARNASGKFYCLLLHTVIQFCNLKNILFSLKISLKENHITV